MPIFDGKERFDLVLSHKGEMKVIEQQPSGQPGVAHVCRVRYLPIAGHKVDTDTKFMAANDAIEVALRPIPSANVFMPYQITIPTMAGYCHASSPSAWRSSRPASRRSRCCIDRAANVSLLTAMRTAA
mgnify:CR=1 FL=1